MKTSYAIKLTLAVGLLLVLTSFTMTALSANWPQWRGTGTGVSEEKNLPTAWNTSQGIKWKTPIAGRGHSSPVVWGNKVFLTSAIEGEAVPGPKPSRMWLKMAKNSCIRTAWAPIANTLSK